MLQPANIGDVPPDMPRPQILRSWIRDILHASQPCVFFAIAAVTTPMEQVPPRDKNEEIEHVIESVPIVVTDIVKSDATVALVDGNPAGLVGSHDAGVPGGLRYASLVVRRPFGGV